MTGTPVPDRLIKCKGQDCHGNFEVTGKWVLYKGQKSGRFMMLKKDGIFFPEINTWHDVESWEYVPDTTAREKE